MSPEGFRELGIKYQMSLPTYKSGPHKGEVKFNNKTKQPYQNLKYIDAPSANLKVIKISSIIRHANKTIVLHGYCYVS